MWQQFTQRARRVVFYSQEEAQNFGERYISTEHLLLGLLREENTAQEVLAALGCDRESLSLDLRRQLPEGTATPSQDMTLSPRAKRVIDLALDESRNFKNDFIGTEHLLLGFVREGDGMAGRMLARHGVLLAQARLAVYELHKARGIDSESPLSPPTPAVQAKNVTERELLHTRQMRYPLDRLALILLTEPGPAEKLLRTAGVHPPTIRTSLEELMLVWPGRKELEVSQSVDSVIQEAAAIAVNDSITSKHLLIAIARNESSFLHYLLKDEGVDVDQLG
jgi:ATP-dependent Clp protease ATP-binding subunit ClpC